MTVLENTSFWLRELAPVDWTTSQFPAIIGARSRPPVGDEGCRLGGGVNLSVRDATQTIPTFRPGFSRTSRVLGRPADYRRFLSAVVGIGDRYPDPAAYFQLYRAVFRGLAVAAVTAMVSVGLYGHQSFVDFRLLLSKIAVASILVLMLISFSATYWHEGLGYLPDAGSFPLKATLIWLICVSVTRGTFGNSGTRTAQTASSRTR